MSDISYAALASHLQEQRNSDNIPCVKCGGDRLRPDHTGSGKCHGALMEVKPFEPR